MDKKSLKQLIKEEIINILSEDNHYKKLVPNLFGADSMVVLTSEEDFREYIKNFIEEYGEKPKFEPKQYPGIEPDPNILTIINPKFQAAQSEYSSAKGREIDDMRKKGESID